MQKTSILGGTLLLTAANLLLRLISILFNVFLARQIGAAGLGLFQLISTVGVFAGLVGASGVRVAAMCLTAEEFGRRRLWGVRSAMSRCLRYGLTLSAVVGLFLFLTAKPIAAGLLGNAQAALSLGVMGLLLPFSCLCGVMTGYYTACGRIRQLVVIEIAERLFSLVLTAVLLLTWAKGDLARACCAVTLGSSLGCVLDFFLLYLQFRRDMRHVTPCTEPLHMKKRLLRFCVPVALNDYLRAGLNTAEQLLIPYGLARFSGDGTQALADYGIIHAMVFPILMFPAVVLYSVSDLLVPELSRGRAMGRRLRISDLGEKCLHLTVLFACAVAGFFFCCAQPLTELVCGSAQVGKALKLFAPLVLLLYTDVIADGMLKGMAEQVSCVRYNTLTAFLDVLLLYLLLPKYGIDGYFFSFTLTHGINLLLSLRRLLKVTQCRPTLQGLLRPVLCLLGAVAAAMLLPAQDTRMGELLLRGGLFLGVYSGLCLLFQALSLEEEKWLSGVLRRSRGKAQGQK